MRTLVMIIIAISMLVIAYIIDYVIDLLVYIGSALSGTHVFTISFNSLSKISPYGVFVLMAVVVALVLSAIFVVMSSLRGGEVGGGVYIG